MTIAERNDLITTEQLLAMPEDGKDRWLIRGELREKEMTKRNQDHSSIEANLAHLLCMWRDVQKEPRGKVLVGEAGIRIRRNPDTTIGVDVAYVSAEVAAARRTEFPYTDGVPVLVAEILSPSDREDEINDKVEAYLDAGVKVVLVADPAFKTITVYRPDREPEMFSLAQTLEVGEAMPGLQIALRDVFEK